MLFYKVDAMIKENESQGETNQRESRRNLCIELQSKSESYYLKNEQNIFIFAVGSRNSKFTFGIISKDVINAEECFINFAKGISVEFSKVYIEETTFKTLLNLLSSSSRNDYIPDDDDVLEYFGIGAMSGRYNNIDYGESMLKGDISKGYLINKSNDFLLGNTLVPEIERIYKGSANNKIKGHPVHYMIKCDDKIVRKEIWQTLLEALYNNGRIRSRRYCFVDYNSECRRPDATYDALYHACENGAMVVRFNGELDSGDYSHGGDEVIAGLCETALKYKNKVLTIFVLPKASEKVREAFLSELSSLSFIEIYEDVAFGDKVIEYLKLKAKEMSIRTDKNLFPCINAEKGYTVTELNKIFDVWYDNKLKNTIFPQYKTAETVKAKIQNAKVKGSAYERLNMLIGLGSAKNVINQALNFYKAQKIFADRSISTNKPAMHMVFTGNPGTAKTTVARLFAGILKENGILSKGELYEVGRADLVGKYVGHTAPKVKEAFKKAKGSVLFIDEAYSLVDDRDGMYGDEAINTIVQEMENNREDMVVIFAGYPDKMEGFLNKNPGLRSRIAFHIPFADYNTEELCQIADLIAEDNGLKLSDEARLNVEKACEKAKTQNDFGNGRFARNIIEKAKMAQANRLVSMDLSVITDTDIETICGEDIEIPEIKVGTKRCIGF